MVKRLIKKYLRPFWFSSKCDEIKPPYVYGFLLIVAMFFSVAVFLVMAWKKYDAATLGTVNLVIGTLAGLYVGVLKLYDTGKKKNDD